MAQLLPFIAAQFLDENGAPYATGTLTCYNTGTTVKADTYTDLALTTANTNPITLDSAGRIPTACFLAAGTYDFLLKDSLGNEIKTQVGINVADANSLSFAATITDLRALPEGASTYAMLSGYNATGNFLHFYYWSASSSAADDNITVIEPVTSPSTGRWLIMSGSPNRAVGRATATITATPTTINVFGIDKLIISNAATANAVIIFSNMTEGQVLYVINNSATNACHLRSGINNNYYVLSTYTDANSQEMATLVYDATLGRWSSSNNFYIVP